MSEGKDRIDYGNATMCKITNRTYEKMSKGSIA